MKADELQRIATRLSNQCFVRHWLHWNTPYHPVVMAIECRDWRCKPMQIQDMEKHGFEWDELDQRYYAYRDEEECQTTTEQIDAHTWHEVEQHILGGSPVIAEAVAGCIKWLANDWLYYREAGLEIVASSYRERLAAIVEAMKQRE